MEDKQIDKLPRYNHIAIRPATFAAFRSLKGDETSDDSLLRKLIKFYKKETDSRQIQSLVTKAQEAQHND